MWFKVYKQMQPTQKSVGSCRVAVHGAERRLFHWVRLCDIKTFFEDFSDMQSQMSMYIWTMSLSVAACVCVAPQMGE